MLKNKRISTVNKQRNRIISCLAIMVMLSFYMIIGMPNQAMAAQYEDRDINGINDAKYPGIKSMIQSLKAAHPNWNFTVFYTGLDWNQVIKNETVAWHGRNLVQGKAGEWLCSICGDKPYDNGTWRCASEKTVSYYMDPRNFLTDNDIFYFQKLSFDERNENIAGVKNILQGTIFSGNITYKDAQGNVQSLNKTYEEVIFQAGKDYNVSAYSLAARIKHEQSSSGSALSKGEYPGYEGLYNLFNIGATGSGSAQIIQNGLTRARNKGWTDPEKSIRGGAEYIAKDYIASGQDTLYLQKYDVDNSDGTLYYFQYMQNVSGALSDARNVKRMYEEMGLMGNEFTFKIPVYENMPGSASAIPSNSGIVTQNVRVNDTNINVRESNSTSSASIARVNPGDILLRIEIASSTQNGYYWDKIVLPDGRVGYIARDFIDKIDDVKTCNDTVYANASVNLRNGPGTNGTTIITTLTKGQALTRIEKGKYNLDGYVWDRVILSDGRQGYLAQNYIDENTSIITEKVKVVTKSGLKIRETVGTNGKILTIVPPGTIITRTQKDCSNVNGYVWDKVVDNNGIEGYVARGDSDMLYIEPVEENIPDPEPDPPVTSGELEKIAVDEGKSQIRLEVNVSVNTLTKEFTGKSVTVKDKNGNEIKDATLIGTGAKVIVDGKEYVAIKMGDIDGDGKISSIDYVSIKMHIMGKETLNDIEKIAADTDKNGLVNSIEYVSIKNHIMGREKITL